MRASTRLMLAVGTIGMLTAVTACGAGAPDESGGGTTITFWQNKFSNEDNAWFKKAVEDYNASQDEVTVKLTVVPGDAWDQKLKAAQAAGKAPDIYTMNYSAVPMNARNEQLAPITEFIDSAAWDDLDPRFLDAVTVDDEQYAYPLYYEPSALLFYRADLFTAAGLDPDSPPTTWADLIDAGEKLKSADSKTVPFQIAQNAVELSWSTWGAQQGTTGHLALTDDWSKSDLDDPQYRELFQFYQDLYSKGLIAKQALSPYGDAAPFGQGKLAMMAAGSWTISQLLVDYPDMIDKIRVAAMPTVDGDASRTTATLGGWTIGVDARSKHVEEAAGAIGWMLAGDVAVPKDYFTTTKYTKLSPRTSVADALAEGDDSAVNPFYDVLAASTETAILEPTYDWQISLAVGTALEKSMLGGNIDEAISEANQTIEKAIKDLGLADQPH